MPSFDQLTDFYLAKGTAQLSNNWVDPDKRKKKAY